MMRWPDAGLVAANQPLTIEPIGIAVPASDPLLLNLVQNYMRAMEATGLPRRIALRSVRVFGTRPGSIVAGIMVSCAFLSMWVSNTATALMMLPIGLSLIELVPAAPGDLDPVGAVGTDRRRFGTVLMLGIAYGCSIGGMGTLIGTPPNAFLAGFMLESYGVAIGFAEWMLLGVPLVVVGLPVAFLVLTRVAFPLDLEELPGGREVVERESAGLGPLTRAERRVATIFVLTALAWMLRPLLVARFTFLAGLSDAGIAMSAALVMFMLPAGDGTDRRLLDWRLARDTPWGVLILFGGGLSLAAAVEATGLSAWLGTAVGGLAGWPIVLLVMAIAGVVILLTELTSNTATAATFLPVLGGVALGLGEDPLLLAVPAALAASGAFMLPVATPPNAIVYGSGSIRIQDMVRAGVWLNLLFVFLITAATYLLLPLVFGV